MNNNPSNEEQIFVVEVQEYLSKAFKVKASDSMEAINKLKEAYFSNDDDKYCLVVGEEGVNFEVDFECLEKKDYPDIYDYLDDIEWVDDD